MSKTKTMQSEAHHTSKLNLFDPTDEDLILCYLKNKVMSCPLPTNIISEVEVYKYDPWDLPGDSDPSVKYFFTRNDGKNSIGYSSNRPTSSGYWKATGVDKVIVASEGNEMVGLRKTLVFYQGKSGQGSKTDWIMHELCLADSSTIRANKRIKLSEESSDNAKHLLEEWVLCKIFVKERIKKNELGIRKEGRKDEDKQRAMPMFLLDLNLSPASSDSSDSSEISSRIGSIQESKDDDAEVTTTS